MPTVSSDIIVEIKLETLRIYADPYEEMPWDCSQFSVNDVLERATKPISLDTHGDHLAQVAWFVVEPDRITRYGFGTIDVGISSLGFYPNWIVSDGNHRYAAALALGWTSLPFIIEGCLEDAEQMFGIEISETP